MHSGNRLCVEFAWRKAIGQFRVIYSNSYVPLRVRGIKQKKSRWDSGMNNSFPSFYLIIRSWPLRPRPHVFWYFFWYFWIRTFFFPDTASVHTYPVNAAYESAPFWIRSSLERGNFWIRYESGIVWTLNPGIFLSGDVTRSSPVLYREYCIQGRARCKFPTLFPRFTTYALLLWRSPGY